MTEKEILPVGVVTVSDGVFHGTRMDGSGQYLMQTLHKNGWPVIFRTVIPDELDLIEQTLRTLVPRISLLLTTGGTGLGPRDVTPEASSRVIQRATPGLVQLMLSAGFSSTPLAALSRAVAGTTGQTLIINLPGSQKAVAENLAALLPVLSHALDLLVGNTEHTPPI